MQTHEYHLYRIKLVKPMQLSLLEGADLTPSQIFIDAIRERPSMKVRRYSEWHIGNLEEFEDAQGAFAIGKTTKRTNEKFDEETGNFVDEEDDTSPYTHVIFDRRLGILGIAKKLKVAPDVRTIARRLRGLIEETDVVKSRNVDVYIDPIPDPEDFITKIRSAYAIRNFRASFTGPNPIDADELFQKPLSVYCAALNGKRGNAFVSGEHLNEEAVESVARKTASTGNTATARVQQKKGKKATSVSLGRSAAQIQVDEQQDRRQSIKEMHEKYFEVRKNAQNKN